MKVLFGVRNDGPDAYYRAKAPATVLRYRGYDVTCRVPVLGEDACTFDVLVLQRHVSAMAELVMREFQERGKPVIYDVDDWLFGIPPTWPVFHDFYEAGRAESTEALEYHRRLLRRADLVTCPTQALAERLAAYNENVLVVPNCILWGDWDSLRPVAHRELDGPVVGWFGSINHWDNWRSVAGVLDAVLAETPAWLAVLGFPELVQLFPDRLSKRTFVGPARRFRSFGHVRREIKTFDVGIAWLDDTPANRCKSPLKALQYGAAGVPVIASKLVYETVLKAGDTFYGYLADTPAELGNLVRCFCHGGLEDAQERAAAWQQRVWEAHSYETQAWRWMHAIEEVIGYERK